MLLCLRLLHFEVWETLLRLHPKIRGSPLLPQHPPRCAALGCVWKSRAQRRGAPIIHEGRGGRHQNWGPLELADGAAQSWCGLLRGHAQFAAMSEIASCRHGNNVLCLLVLRVPKTQYTGAVFCAARKFKRLKSRKEINVEGLTCLAYCGPNGSKTLGALFL